MPVFKCSDSGMARDYFERACSTSSAVFGAEHKDVISCQVRGCGLLFGVYFVISTRRSFVTIS